MSPGFDELVRRVWPDGHSSFEVLGGGITNHNLKVTRPEVTSVHAEVYASPQGPAGDTAPVVAAMGMTFEPSLFVVGADGIVVERLDFVFDRVELNAALDLAVS